MTLNPLPHLRSTIRRAFTLVEVLVVISIFVLLLAIAVPAFSSMLYSSEQSLVENSIRIAMGSARNYAARSPSGQDAAAVFIYDAETKKCSIVTCTFAGTLMDKPPPNAPPGVTGIQRDIFAIAPGIEPMQLTSGWTIRGLAPAFSIDEEWYETTYGPGSTPNLSNQANWLLPETSFYKDNVSNSGRDRQSFMIRFEGGTGMVKTSSPHTALVHYPSNNQILHATWPPIPPGSNGITNANNPLNPDNETDYYRYVRRVLAWPGPSSVPGNSNGGAGALALTLKQQILGDESADTILCKSIGQFAVCSERHLARGIGVELNQSTGTVYTSTTQPVIDPTVPTLRDKVNEWIVNRDPSGNPLDSDARIFTIQRYLGWLQEVTGTQGGLGVGS